jgi:nitric oxide reductase NorD protein
MNSHIPFSSPAGLPAPIERLSTGQLEKRLDESLDPVLSSRRTAHALALGIAPLTRELQDFALHWVGVIARTSGELAYQFAALAPGVLPAVDTVTAEAWIIHAMDTFDREGLHRGSAELKNAEAFILAAGRNDHAITFKDAGNVLGLFICGLAGRPLKLEVATETYTDTETIHLPARIFAHASRTRNFLLYKALATHLWAQSRYGTFNVDPVRALAGYADPARALALYHYFETTRIDAIIARELPGLARELATLRNDFVPPPECRRLAESTANAADSLALVSTLYAQFEPPQLSYMGTLHPEIARAVRASRIAREKKALQAELASLQAEHAGVADAKMHGDGIPQYTLTAGAQAGTGDGIELRRDGEPITLPDHVYDLLQSISTDLGAIPDEYLAPAGDGYQTETRSIPDNAAADSEDVYREATATLYDEWDYKRRHYRKNWCMLRETDVAPGTSAFVDATLARYAVQITRLRRTFEMLRGENKRMKRQPSGDDIDLDAVVTALADMRSGTELPERLFERRRKVERDIAVMFMVDMSGSTKGWINDAERESLVMLCEALEVLGDRYAIYGFSGVTRKRCEIFRIKRFADRYDDTVRRRIAGILPQDYTRMGVAIRHLSALLNTVDARTRLLITLSDGKPDDYSDNYRGEYGIEDTRQALIEANRDGIHPFCITIDREAREYLPRMYGAVNYTVIDDVARLPLKVADVYRRLTT